jgi:hypothetical protein
MTKKKTTGEKTARKKKVKDLKLNTETVENLSDNPDKSEAGILPPHVP